MANSDNQTTPPHIALLPSAGMGHLAPFLRLAALLSSSHNNCMTIITLITPTPTISTAESAHFSAFFSTHPHVRRLNFPIPPFDAEEMVVNTDDPFFIRWSQISHSLIPLLSPLLSSLSPPLSAVLTDFTASNSFSQLAEALSVPYYVVFTSSAKCLSLFASLPSLKLGGIEDYVEIPDLPPVAKSSLPPPFFNPSHFFTSFALSNVQSFPKATGILLNTFEAFESETITALNSGRVLSLKLPHVIPIGPLEPFKVENSEKREKGSDYLVWLDGQSEGSVVYVSFGSRTAMSKEQIREIGDGLERSGCAFFWILKGSKVDKEDTGGIEELLGESFFERTKSRGIAVKGWVDQEEILSHPAIGGFVSHCGWNSVMEAARNGVPVLAWPLHGDQKVNAEVMEKAGLGVWEREWGWGGERLVRGEEVGEKVREMMSDGKLRRRGREIGEETRKARVESGSSQKAWTEFVDALKSTDLAKNLG